MHRAVVALLFVGVLFAASAAAAVAQASAATLRVAGRPPEGFVNRALQARIEHRRQARGEANLAGPPDQWFTQKRDHYNVQDTTTWQQLYFVNDAFYKPGKSAPVFLYISGEGPMYSSAVVNQKLVLWAKKYGALVIALEHRFYGRSYPTQDLSTKHLAWLSSQQALADLAYFRQEMAKKYSAQDSKWIVFGGSYAGAMASWMREKYPDLVFGAVGSSGPVRAILDFTEYVQVLERSMLAKGSSDCVSAVRKANAKLAELLKTVEGQKRVSGYFPLCAPVESNTNGLACLIDNLEGVFADVIQYNDEVKGRWDISTICSLMTANTTDPLQGWGDMVRLYLAKKGQECMDVSYTNMISKLRNSSVSTDVGGRMWLYQTCAEFGYFQTTDAGSAQPFAEYMPLSYFTSQCNDVFGMAAGPDIEYTNTYYGSDHPGSTNVVFPNGSIDPWHALSVTKSLSDTLIAVYIEGTAHCADMDEYDPELDPPAKKEAQAKIEGVLDSWLLQI